MKKFIALGGIAAMGTFGFLGLGSTAAFAAGVPGSAQAQICTAATNGLNATQAQFNIDTAASNNALAAQAAAAALLGPDVANYVTTAMKVIHDVDKTPPVTSQQQAADQAAFTTATNTVVNDYVASSGADVAVFNASRALSVDNFRLNVFGSLKMSSC